ncbi:hypothetical protein B0H13DRAFT_1909821 [Mycena leptocephala]|nr:hypothetical protein B0H13DRAFT_1909821 [Mycena leptocephala]
MNSLFTSRKNHLLYGLSSLFRRQHHSRCLPNRSPAIISAFGSDDNPDVHILQAASQMIHPNSKLGHTLYVDTISEYAHPERVQGAPPKSFTTAIFLSGLIGACGKYFLNAFGVLTHAPQCKRSSRSESTAFKDIVVHPHPHLGYGAPAPTVECSDLFQSSAVDLGGHLRDEMAMAPDSDVEHKRGKRFDSHGSAGGPPLPP